MKIRVNQDACIGCGACPSIAKEVFELNDEGLSYAKVEEIKDDLKEEVLDAINSCPTGAIEEIKED